MPFTLFKKEKEITEQKIEDSQDLEKTEIEDLNKIEESEQPPLPADEPPEQLEMPERIEEPTISGPITDNIAELDEATLKELNQKIDMELENIRQRFNDIGKTAGLTLESPEMIDLLDLYTAAKDKLQEFINEINSLNLSSMGEKKTFAAIYKFRACRTLSEIKKEILKIESISRKAGFIPSKVHEILNSKAEDLIYSFIKGKKEENHNKQKSK